ncbi:hypothetical protein [Streptomyces parvulus]
MGPNTVAIPTDAVPTLRGVNEALDLYSGELLVSQGSKSETLLGVVRWKWLPTPRIQYEFSDDSPAAFEWDISEDFEVEIPDAAGSEDFEPVIEDDSESSASQGSYVRVEGYLKPKTFGSSSGYKSVLFQIPNMPEVYGHWLSSEKKQWKGRLVYEAGEWEVVIDSRRDRNVIHRELRKFGGYGVTHTAKLSRRDGALMAESDVFDAFTLIRCVLSLAFGRKITPILGVGLDEAGQIMWRDWRVFAVQSWSGAHQMIDETGYSSLGDLFKKFGSLWSDEFTKELLSNSVHYYLECLDPTPVNLAVSAGQAGLELLAYEKQVDKDKVKTSKQYKSQTAAENIAELLAAYGIDDQIPATCSKLTAAASKVDPKCKNGPEIVTRMRNGVIHLSRTKPKFETDAWIDCWQLVSKYLALSILGRVDYEESYRDPLDTNKHVGAVTKVPWA